MSDASGYDTHGGNSYDGYNGRRSALIIKSPLDDTIFDSASFKIQNMLFVHHPPLNTKPMSFNSMSLIQNL